MPWHKLLPKGHCIIKSAEKAGVKRVVMTGNFGAVGFSNKDPAYYNESIGLILMNQVSL